MRILLVDNYDSFTFNLVHYLEDLEATVTVLRNDMVLPKETDGYDGLVFSPGPGLPKEADNMNDLLKYQLAKPVEHQVPILGICLGHQAIIELLGGKIKNLNRVYHGVAMEMKVSVVNPLFEGIPQRFLAGRYHSWCGVAENLPHELQVNCTDADGEIMGIQHRNRPIFGLQFHPESIMTEHGKTMLANFLNLIGR